MTTPAALRTLIPAAALGLAAALLPQSVSGETVDTINRTFQVSQGGKLTIDVDAGSIDVRPGAGDTVVIEVVRKFRASSEATEKEMLAEHVVTIEQSGKDVSIIARKPRSTESVWSWFSRGPRRDIRYTVTVPQSYNANLRSAGGPIQVQGLRGSIETHTSGGPLKFADIRGPINGGTSGGPIDIKSCEGEVAVHTSGGPIDAEDCVGNFKLSTSGGGISIAGHRGRVAAHTSGGGIRMERIDGEIDASTSGGPVSASFTHQPTGDCRLHTSGGGVSLEVPSNAKFRLDARTSGGGVSCNLPGGSDVEKSRGKLRATYNGGGPTIELSSSGGGIDVDATAAVEG